MPVHAPARSPQTAAEQARTASVPALLWLEITGRCPLECWHCYARSGPAGTHGSMTADDWRSVIDQAAALGVDLVQFIGGEPTTHPQFAGLLGHAITSGLAVEVYTNLLHVKDAWWELFTCPNVSLATSWYSDAPAQHDAITRRSGSHARTRANIAEAVRRGIPLRASIIALDDDQRTGQAYAELEALGVASIGVDHLRQVGRGVRSPVSGVSQLCGNCGRGVAAISPDGDVWPCVFARWMTAGNVMQAPLADILAGPAMAGAVARIPGQRNSPQGCGPNICLPNCTPSNWNCKPHKTPALDSHD